MKGSILLAVSLGATALAQQTISTGTRSAGRLNESRDTNPAASNPNLPLPGTANPNSRAAPMVPNPQPVPSPGGPIVPGDTGPRQVPGPGGAQGSPSQPRSDSDDGSEARHLRDIREAVLRAPAGEQEAAESEERIRDLKVFLRGGKVVLSGVVRTRAEKRAAGERAAEAAGRRPIVNELKVKE